MSLLQKFKSLAAPALVYSASFFPSEALLDAAPHAPPVANQQLQKSRLVPDADGILWFQQGADRNTAISMGGRISEQTDGFVIIFSTTEEYKEQATKHALKLAAWFSKHRSTPDEIPVVAYLNNKGVGYMYSIDGMLYKHDVYAPKWVMTPEGTVATLEDAALDYFATDFINKRDGTYDKDKPREVAGLDYP